MANPSGYVNLLNSQNPIDLESPEANWFGSQVSDEPGVKERRKWTLTDDKILIGAWLNTKEELTKLQAVLGTKERISRHKLLDRLLAKTEPLSEMETTLKLKLMSEML
uniref:Uncharacterized protein n=1 Tax=Brassica campestris TaxID=3711 RepID=A0A3P5YLT6_BRACM|nr:unnamed protein product [Brassica rapa]